MRVVGDRIWDGCPMSPARRPSRTPPNLRPSQGVMVENSRFVDVVIPARGTSRRRFVESEGHRCAGGPSARLAKLVRARSLWLGKPSAREPHSQSLPAGPYRGTPRTRVCRANGREYTVSSVDVGFGACPLIVREGRVDEAGSGRRLGECRWASLGA